jgi:hypothetical protein
MSELTSEPDSTGGGKKKGIFSEQGKRIFLF